MIIISESGSHLASAHMVVTKQAEWAAVDSTVLLYPKKYMQDGGKDITILETLGRLPPYPIVVNKKLPGIYEYMLYFLSTYYSMIVWDHYITVKHTKFNYYLNPIKKAFIHYLLLLLFLTIYLLCR